VCIACRVCASMGVRFSPRCCVSLMCPFTPCICAGDSILDPHPARLAAKADLAAKPPVTQFVVLEHAFAASLVAKVHADIQVGRGLGPPAACVCVHVALRVAAAAKDAVQLWCGPACVCMFVCRCREQELKAVVFGTGLLTPDVQVRAALAASACAGGRARRGTHACVCVVWSS
jgi:hypothetical protein